MGNKIFSEGKKYVFILDGETDGLYGDFFAIAAVVADINTLEIADTFEMYVAELLIAPKSFKGLTNTWVRENILPVLRETVLVKNCTLTKASLVEEFWNFYEKYREESIIIADFGAPVESNIFRDCVNADIKDREFKGPYPMHEFGTILMMKNIDPDSSRDKYYTNPEHKHNPYQDVLSTLRFIKNEKLFE